MYSHHGMNMYNLRSRAIVQGEGISFWTFLDDNIRSMSRTRETFKSFKRSIFLSNPPRTMSDYMSEFKVQDSMMRLSCCTGLPECTCLHEGRGVWQKCPNSGAKVASLLSNPITYKGHLRQHPRNRPSCHTSSKIILEMMMISRLIGAAKIIETARACQGF